ncbi:MAG: hypothetical protein ABH844_05475 [Candidatus Omnitrophota bacterium]
MKKKQHVHSCDFSGSLGVKKRVKSKSPARQNRKRVKAIFDKYYRNQVSALYRAVRDWQ